MAADPTARKKTRYHHGDLRAELLAATRRLVEAHGPDGFSLAEACREAGVSTAAPYRHFRDREAMLLAVVQEGMERHYNQMVAALEVTPRRNCDRIVALGRVYVAFARAEPQIFRLIFGRRFDVKPDDALPGLGVRPLGLVESEVAAVRGQTEIDADIRHRAFTLWTMVHGLSFLLIDQKVSIAEMGLDLDAFLTDIAQRITA